MQNTTSVTPNRKFSKVAWLCLHYARLARQWLMLILMLALYVQAYSLSIWGTTKLSSRYSRSRIKFRVELKCLYGLTSQGWTTLKCTLVILWISLCIQTQHLIIHSCEFSGGRFVQASCDLTNDTTQLLPHQCRPRGTAAKVGRCAWALHWATQRSVHVQLTQVLDHGYECIVSLQYLQRFSGRLKLHVYGVKLQVEVQSAMTTNYIDTAVYMFCISGHGWLHFNLQLHTAFNLPENLCINILRAW